jgi:CubicO group peptidase (beta-lactamase class C family)
MKTLIKSFVFIIVLSSLLYAQKKEEKIAPKMKEVITKAVELDLFSGIVLVAKEGKVIFHQAYGEANKDFHIKNKQTTKFNICSLTKQFTSASIMLLAQKGMLKISDPVINYLPDFPFGSQITIYHLLTHTAGLGNYQANPEYNSKMFSLKGINEILPLIYKEKLVNKTPGEKWIYSNSGAVVLGAVIEKVSGMKYANFLQKNIFEPLKMKNTISVFPNMVVEDRAIGYIKKVSGGFLNTLYDVNPPTSATGLLTTAEDLFLFDQALYGNSFINDEYKKIMFKPYLANYACLWSVSKRYNNTVVGHIGAQPGFNSWFMRYIDGGYTIIILSNFENGADIVVNSIEAILFGQKYILPRKPIGEYLVKLIKEKGYSQISADIKNILKEGGYEIKNIDALNDLGYTLINQEDIDLAKSIFLLNTELFPDNADVYDSLAEAYMNSGDNKLAIENYEKSLKMNPQNSNAVQKLQILHGMNSK